MQTYKHILVAVDGSPTSDHALKQAMTLAHEVQATLRIVHVIDEMAFNWDIEFEYMESVLAYIHESGKRLLAAATKTARDFGVKVESTLLTIALPGQRVGEVIAQEADDAKADLIVIGTHGRRGVSHLILGSVAETVVRAATIPVLLIHE